MSTNDIHGIENGWSVKTSDGHDIGSVEESTLRYILVKSGLVGTAHRYLPSATLAHVRPEMKEIGISLTQADVEAGDWSEPPAEGPRTDGAPLNLGDDLHDADPMTAVPRDPEKPARI
jgi:hypothetical protein